jgi:hypothetical protein
MTRTRQSAEDQSATVVIPEASELVWAAYCLTFATYVALSGMKPYSQYPKAGESSHLWNLPAFCKHIQRKGNREDLR